MTIRVLIVEDNRGLRDAMRCQLAEIPKIEATFCADGSEFVEFAATRQFDAYVVDITLPDISGWELLEQLAQRELARPTFVASGMVCTKQQLAQSGARGALLKPFEIEQLLELLETMLDCVE